MVWAPRVAVAAPLFAVGDIMTITNPIALFRITYRRPTERIPFRALLPLARKPFAIQWAHNLTPEGNLRGAYLAVMTFGARPASTDQCHAVLPTGKLPAGKNITPTHAAQHHREPFHFKKGKSASGHFQLSRAVLAAARCPLRTDNDCSYADAANDASYAK